MHKRESRSAEASERKADVVAAKPEGVGQHSCQCLISGGVGHDIQITIGIWSSVIDRRWDDSVLQS